MSSEIDEFKGKSIKQVQIDYFMRILPIEEKGWYYYQNKGIQAESGDLILFQMNNVIIASAIFDINIKNVPAFTVDIDTIKVFKPITNEELSSIIFNLNKFDRIKRVYNVENVNMELLFNRMNLPID